MHPEFTKTFHGLRRGRGQGCRRERVECYRKRGLAAAVSGEDRTEHRYYVRKTTVGSMSCTTKYCPVLREAPFRLN